LVARESDKDQQIGRLNMSGFVPVAVRAPHHFEVTENGRGYWVAEDKEGLRRILICKLIVVSLRSEHDLVHQDEGEAEGQNPD
jgi:hypothetical protein